MDYIFENLEIKENYSNINNNDNISSLKLDKETIDNMKSDLIKQKSKVFLKDSIRKKDLELKIKNLTNQQNHLRDKIDNNLESVKDNPSINTDIPTPTTIPNDKKCVGTVTDGIFKNESCDSAYNTMIKNSNVNHANGWCNRVGGCSLVDANNELQTTIPNDYPGILQFGNSPDDFQDSKSLDCQNGILFEDAKNMCREANDCNSFFAYEGKPGMSGRVCFKDNAQRDKEKIPSDVTNYPNSGYYFV